MTREVQGGTAHDTDIAQPSRRVEGSRGHRGCRIGRQQLRLAPRALRGAPRRRSTACYGRPSTPRRCPAWSRWPPPTRACSTKGAFGLRALDQSAPMTLDTVFRIASMTKAITSVAAMQLVEQGKLKLEEPVPGVDPALGTPEVLEGFDAAGAPQAAAGQAADHAAPPADPHGRVQLRRLGREHGALHQGRGRARRGAPASWRPSARRWSSIPATGGSTASTPTGSAASSRRSAASRSTSTSATRSSRRSA